MSTLLLPIAAMIVVVVSSNILVQVPINDWLTWGALTYPVAFLVTDITNRMFGAARARRVVQVGFAFAVVLSIWMADARIAFASGSAFLIAQLLDISIFNRLRARAWWQAPLASSVIGSAVDTGLFFSLAFYGTAVPWVTLAAGDYAVKLALALTMLIPFRVAFTLTAARGQA